MPIKYKTVTVERHGVVYRDGFVCDKCKTKFDADDIFENQEMFYHNWCGGYGSVWGDGNEYALSICQSCWLELFGKIVEEIDNE